ncbi:MAG: T9SS type A sorting domain-containing protein [Burkholderiales bacterium]|nr:T9SS type A sorting domain-containing protein [Bacteroidia bacterium]
MKKILFLLFTVVKCFSQAGTFDNTFDTDGIQTFCQATVFDFTPSDAGIQSTGKIIQLCYSNNNSTNCVDNTVFVHVSSSGRMANPTTELDPLNISIAPNPSEEVFNINFNQVLKGNVTLEVFSMLGQKVYSDTIENQKEHQMILHSLNAGAYILKISNNNQTISKKLIKN